MSPFKLDQCTDKLRNLFTFHFDNLKVLTFEIDFSISFKADKFFMLL